MMAKGAATGRSGTDQSPSVGGAGGGVEVAVSGFGADDGVWWSVAEEPGGAFERRPRWAGIATQEFEPLFFGAEVSAGDGGGVGGRSGRAVGSRRGTAATRTAALPSATSTWETFDARGAPGLTSTDLSHAAIPS